MGAPGALEWIGIFYNESSSKSVGVGSLYFLCSWFLFCAFFFPPSSVSTGFLFFYRGVL